MNPIATVTQLLSGGLNRKEARSAGPLTLVPLFGGLPAPEYIVGADAFAAGTLQINEIGEGGIVTALQAHNQGALPVLLIDGEHLEGAKQNRILNASCLIAAGRTTTLPVACVEQGRWHYEGDAGFAPGEDHAYGRLRSRNAVTRAESVRATGARAVDQGQVWADVAVKHQEAGSFSTTGAIKDAFDHRRVELDGIKQAFAAPEPEQSGVIACIGGRPIALDAFDRPETLLKLWPRLLSGYALDALGQSAADVPEHAIDLFMSSAAGATTTAHEGLGLGMDVVITSDRVVGNALTWDEGVVHLAIFALVSEGQRQSNRASRIAAPSSRRRNQGA